MLRFSALKTAHQTAQALVNDGFQLAPMPNSELSELVRFSHSPVNLSNTTDTIINNPEAVLSYYSYIVTGDENNDTSDHSKEIDNLSEQLAQIVKQHVAYAKNVVKPKVMEFGEKLSLFLQEKIGR